MSTIAYLNNGAIPLPNVRSVKPGREIIADRSRTAGGKMRQDVTAVKRAWRLELRYLTPAEYLAIVNHLDWLWYGPTTFWIDSLGGAPETDSVAAYVTIEDDERVQFGRDGTWYSDGHNLILSVVEQ